jgi:hypothetical protein
VILDKNREICVRVVTDLIVDCLEEGKCAYSYLRKAAMSQGKEKKEINDEMELKLHLKDRSEVNLGSEEIMDIEEIISAECMSSGSLDDLDGLRQIVRNEASRMDRLPKANSLEALEIIKDAWNVVDIATHVAKQYKLIAKASYVFLLFLGLLLTVITVATTADNIMSGNGPHCLYPV